MALFWYNHSGMYREDRLKPLKSYKYQGIDKSFISRYILTPYWNWVVTLIPLWVAPNLITLIGLGFMVAALIVALIFIPDLVGPGPSWTYFFFAFCMWMYSTLDNVDGKQARRTGSSSPLGELFDHGCDSLNCTLGGIIQVAAMGLGSSTYGIFALTLIFWGFYLPTWEEYHTGVLYLGYINGPTEGVLFAIGLMIMSGIFGPSIWATQVKNCHYKLQNLPISNFQLLDISVAITALVFFLIYVPICIRGVWKICKERNKSFKIAIFQLLPMLAVTIAAGAWIWSPYSYLITNGHFPLFIIAFGVGFGKMATKIIYAHLTKRHFPHHSGLMIPLFIGSILINFPLLLPKKNNQIPIIILDSKNELLFLWGWLIIASIGYLNWSYHLIDSFCKYLDINCFSLKNQKEN